MEMKIFYLLEILLLGNAITVLNVLADPSSPTDFKLK